MSRVLKGSFWFWVFAFLGGRRSWGFLLGSSGSGTGHESIESGGARGHGSGIRVRVRRVEGLEGDGFGREERQQEERRENETSSESETMRENGVSYPARPQREHQLTKASVRVGARVIEVIFM